MLQDASPFFFQPDGTASDADTESTPRYVESKPAGHSARFEGCLLSLRHPERLLTLPTLAHPQQSQPWGASVLPWSVTVIAAFGPRVTAI
jgi:hypothetical protein